jgi:hypothetical protein
VREIPLGCSWGCVARSGYPTLTGSGPEVSGFPARGNTARETITLQRGDSPPRTIQPGLARLRLRMDRACCRDAGDRSSRTSRVGDCLEMISIEGLRSASTRIESDRNHPGAPLLHRMFSRTAIRAERGTLACKWFARGRFRGHPTRTASRRSPARTTVLKRDPSLAFGSCRNPCKLLPDGGGGFVPPAVSHCGWMT